MIAVAGSLVIAGSAGAPVVLTSLRDDSVGGDTNGDGAASVPAPGDWGWVLFHAGSHGTLQYADIAYGGVGYHGYTNWAMVKVYGPADVEVDRTTLRQSWTDGLYAENASVRVTRSRITSHGNRSGVTYGLNFNGLDPNLPLEITDNVFETTWPRESAAQIKFGHHPTQISLLRNQASGSGWNGLVLDGRVERDLLLDAQAGLPLIVAASISVAPDATLAVSPGAVIKLTGCGPKIVVEGALVAPGEDDAPIVLTSVRDDGVGGDTNGDGAASLPAPADWGYVLLLRRCRRCLGPRGAALRRRRLHRLRQLLDAAGVCRRHGPRAQHAREQLWQRAVCGGLQRLGAEQSHPRQRSVRRQRGLGVQRNGSGSPPRDHRQRVRDPRPGPDRGPADLRQPPWRDPAAAKRRQRQRSQWHRARRHRAA